MGGDHKSDTNDEETEPKCDILRVIEDLNYLVYSERETIAASGGSAKSQSESLPLLPGCAEHLLKLVEAAYEEECRKVTGYSCSITYFFIRI